MSEKDYNPNMKEKKAMDKQGLKDVKKVEAPAKEEISPKEESKTETNVKEKIEKKKPVKHQKVKRDFAVVNLKDAPLSTKYSVYVCDFIRGKMIEKAIADLEDVIAMKRAIPMKGEIPHRKGKGMGPGRYITKTAERFLKAVKSLQANANENLVENAYIAEAVANKASRPFGKFGRVKKKRTHLKLVAKEKVKTGNKEKKEKKK